MDDAPCAPPRPRGLALVLDGRKEVGNCDVASRGVVAAVSTMAGVIAKRSWNATEKGRSTALQTRARSARRKPRWPHRRRRGTTTSSGWTGTA